MATRELDLMDPTVFRRGVPHSYFRELRQSPGLTPGHDTDGEKFWHVVRHREVSGISRDTKLWSSSPTTMTSVRKIDPSPPIITFLDSPDHTRLRKLTFKAFTPARLAALEARLRQIIAELLAGAREQGEFDLADEVALRLPFEALFALLDIPESDRPMLLRWGKQTVNLGDPEYDESAAPAQPADNENYFEKIYEYLLDFARHRAAHPADDCFSLLLEARLTGSRLNLPDRLTADEVGLFASTLVTAGSETTYAAITGGVPAFLEFPDQARALRADRSLVPMAADEVLRWVTPVTHFTRRAVAGTEVAGQPVAAGERVVLWYSSANRDEDVFADPAAFDITRRPNPHVSFGGGGPHVCIGNNLATMELRLFLEGVIDVLPELEPAGTPLRPTTNFMNGYKYLPLRFR
ncbi:Steroid C26-monooxygenase [Streptomyces sp. RB5]|uniref:Steroid C26-monooxygenase n=1 Tax=Streptomyces smaragdinus TaxID=2585196 RepID=A0A7K0CDS3_9ACTN|nr:cytochrome P450 [Streptomyces smaragdinus]MQY11617.1 Steroid C26-monooxygenase [Streptomyces smaragdinus]